MTELQASGSVVVASCPVTYTYEHIEARTLDHNRLRLDSTVAIERVALWSSDRRVGDIAGIGDRLAGLESLGDLAEHVDYCQRELVKRLREDGATWRAIGDHLKVTRSAAQQRFSPSPVVACRGG